LGVMLRPAMQNVDRPDIIGLPTVLIDCSLSQIAP
jgi:hypothetical protein